MHGGTKIFSVSILGGLQNQILENSWLRKKLQNVYEKTLVKMSVLFNA